MSEFAARITAILMASSFASTAFAFDNLSELDTQARAIQQNPAAHVDISEFQQLPSDDVLKLAEEVVGAAGAAMQAGKAEAYDFAGVDESTVLQKSEMPHEEWVDILVSRSLGEAELKALFARLDESPIPVRIVFVGIAEGQNLNEAFLDFGRWAKDLENPPEGTIDPDAFSSRDVTSVPRMIFMREGESVAEVDGLSNPSWLASQVEAGRTGYLGQQGPTVAVSERNLIDVIKERLAGIDLEERKVQTVQTYWERANFYAVPPATENRERIVDPSIVVTKNILDGRGNIIMPAGKVVNPLHMKPFGMRLVVFNPNRAVEVEWVSALPPAPGLKDIFMITELDRDKGWDHFNSIEDALDSPVYLITQDVHSRYDIRNSPTLVTADDSNFIVTEYAVPEASKEP